MKKENKKILSFYKLNPEEFNVNNKQLSTEFIHKFYGGVLGKFIGVLVGIPFEFNRTSAEIQRQYPYINTYNECNYETYADDDTNGFVIFSKIFELIDSLDELTPEKVAYVILNYAAECRGMFWWDDSTESKAFNNLINGVSPSESGDYAHNGDSADTVGGQIFYDAVGLIFAGNPELAAETASKIARVMHNGEGAVGAMFISACISAAFIESDMHEIVNTALSIIPSDSKYAEMARTVIEFYKKNPYDWKYCLHMIETRYKEYYVWDFGAHVLLALLYGHGNFDYSIEICLQSGGDTDCNCGNVGTILGVFGSCEGIDYHRWVEKLNDTVILSSAVPCENEVSITRFTAKLLLLYCKFNNADIPEYIQNAARDDTISFAFPYSYQGFNLDFWLNDKEISRESISKHRRSILVVPKYETPIAPPSGSPYMLKIWADEIRGANNKYFYKIHKHYNTGDFDLKKYEPTSCTSLYSGQTVNLSLFTKFNECSMKIYISAHNSSGNEKYSKPFKLNSNEWNKISWELPQINGFFDYLNICIEPDGDSSADSGYDGLDLYIDSIIISGKSQYIIDYSKLTNVLNNEYHYPLLRNFTVPYGEIIKHPYHIHLYSGYPEHSLKSPQYQSIAKNKHYSLAFTGCYLKNGEYIHCTIGIPDNPYDFSENSSLVVIAAKGIIDHYAVGFKNNSIVILKSERLPGAYTVLESKPFEYEVNRIYSLHISINNGKIYCFCSPRIMSTGNNKGVEIQCQTNSNLDGCFGFASEGYGVDIYNYSVNAY